MERKIKLVRGKEFVEASLMGKRIIIGGCGWSRWIEPYKIIENILGEDYMDYWFNQDTYHLNFFDKTRFLLKKLGITGNQVVAKIPYKNGSFDHQSPETEIIIGK